MNITISSKKVLHVIPGFGGGIAAHVWNLATSLDKSKVVIDVVSFSIPSDEFIKDIKANGGNVFVISRLKDVSLLGFINNFNNILKNNGPYYMIHLHQSEFRALLFTILAKKSGIERSAIHSHISDKANSNKMLFKLKMRFYRFINKHSTTDMVSCSKLASNYLYGNDQVQKNKIMHMPNSIVAEKFFVTENPEEIYKFKRNHHINEKTLVIGHIGYFGYQKNHEFMVKIINKMINEKIDFVWLFLGEGPGKEQIEEKIKELNAEKYVRFLGRRKDVPFIFSCMDIMVLPSHFEGLPTVAVEAQAAGVPSIISDNVTNEADMGMGITRYVPLEKEDLWIDAILEMASVRIPDTAIRRETLEKKNFTSEKAAKLYESFVWENIRTYNLGDR